MDVMHAATGIVEYAMAHDLIDIRDRIWAYNAVLEAVGATGPAPEFPVNPDDDCDLQELLEALVEAARVTGALAPEGDGEILATHIMGILTPRPSEVARRFRALLGEDPRAATDYLYRLSTDVDYVKLTAIARDLKWSAATPWGPLEITINLSKPEKDPRDIAREAALPVDDEIYPACRLCISNEGYAGRRLSASGRAYPARQNLRIAPIRLTGQRWGLQYSPHAYFAEHCIAMNVRHVPMRIDRGCFERLLDFVDLFPHYFIGSNADLPIVGGSILSHDHFQGGRHVFPMERADIDATVRMPGHERVEVGIVHWPVTVLRLRCDDRVALLDAAEHILDAWRGYTDALAGVYAETDGVPHNTVTPIARRRDDVYTLDLALRCNVTSDMYPYGVFHPHDDLHHIKKENIGLIEVMGLAVLPPRLDRELDAVAHALVNGKRLENDPLAQPHAAWAHAVAARHPELDSSCIIGILHHEIGLTFARVLEDTGVFKWDAPGRKALMRFLATL